VQPFSKVYFSPDTLLNKSFFVLKHVKTLEK
jgi:hypothetical protein